MDMRSNTPPDFTVKTDRDDLDLSAEQVVVAYHERTKHHYHRYAASLGYLDWAKQPDPFRRYDGAPLVRLPLPDAGQALPYWQLYVDRVAASHTVALKIFDQLRHGDREIGAAEVICCIANIEQSHRPRLAGVQSDGNAWRRAGRGLCKTTHLPSNVW